MSRAAAAPTSAKATACLGRLPPLRGGRREARGEAATTCAGRFVGHETQHPLSRRARERWAFEAKSSRVVYGAIKNEESYTLELTEENVETVLDEVRPYLMADGGNVELVEIDGLTVKLRLQGACGSCPSSMTTMRMGIQRKLMEKIPEILEVEQLMDEIRPYLVGAGGGSIEL